MRRCDHHQSRAGAGPAVDPAEAEVVHADQEHVPVGVVRAGGRRAEEVRGEEDAAGRRLQRGRQLDHGDVDVGVGVQVDDLFGLLEQRLQQERLDRRGELHQVVGHHELQHACDAGQAERRRAQALDAVELRQLASSATSMKRMCRIAPSSWRRRLSPSASALGR